MYMMHTDQSQLPHSPISLLFLSTCPHFLTKLSLSSLFILFWSTDLSRVIYVTMGLPLVSTFAYICCTITDQQPLEIQRKHENKHHKQHVHDINKHFWLCRPPKGLWIPSIYIRATTALVNVSKVLISFPASLMFF